MASIDNEVAPLHHRGPAAVREALVGAAMALLPDRAPSSVSGRELAERAGVNYGLVHHYFGSKDEVFRQALLRMRREFVDRHGDPGSWPLMTDARDPYVRALGRSQVDYPNELGPRSDGLIGDSLVATVRARLEQMGLDGEPARTVEAKGRALAMLSMQLGYNVFQAMLRDSIGVGAAEHGEVEAVVARIYREIACQP